MPAERLDARSRRLPASRGEQRTNVTYVATISDDTELNKRLRATKKLAMKPATLEVAKELLVQRGFF